MVLPAFTMCPSGKTSAEWKLQPLARAIESRHSARSVVARAQSAILAEGTSPRLREAFMADLYTCSCGNQTWKIFDTGVRCTACNTEYPVQHTPVGEFNHAVTEELEEALEE
jgi:hypothetical protein